MGDQPAPPNAPPAVVPCPIDQRQTLPGSGGALNPNYGQILDPASCLDEHAPNGHWEEDCITVTMGGPNTGRHAYTGPSFWNTPQ
eukprot:COSAG01_NODE_15866_length_1291_cov_1.379195_2_plen_84_part_01